MSRKFEHGDQSAAQKDCPPRTTRRPYVTNLATGASVDVVVNDRGPYVYGRDIDLSRAAAQAIGVIRPGFAAVRIEVIIDAGPVRRADWRSPGRRAAG